MYQNWSNLYRLDGNIAQRNATTLYHGNKQILTVEKGVTFGLLKMLYNANFSSNCNVLLGVRPRAEALQRIISSESTILDNDEYDLIISDQCNSQFMQVNQTSPSTITGPRNLQSLQQLLSQCQGNDATTQRSLTQLPPLFYSLPSLSDYQETVFSNLYQPILTCSTTVKSSAIQKEPEAYVQPELSNFSNTEVQLQAAEKTDEASLVESICDKRNTDKDVDLHPEIGDLIVGKKIQDLSVETVKFAFQCDVCHMPFKSKSKFMYHKRRHTEENPHLCIYCGESFKFFTELSQHRNKLHLCNKTFKCDDCTRSFSTRKELKQHMWRHTGKKSCKCELCGKEYSSEGNLSSHRQKHSGLKPLQCSLCPKMFRYKTVLENHIRNSHTGEKPFSCRYCRRTFSTSSQLSSHQKRHSDLKPHICLECGKSFRRSHNLNRHSRLHADVRLYKCHVCCKTFRELSHLQYHKSTHTSKKDRCIVCPICDKKIIIGKGIRRHLKLYHNEKCSNEEDAKNILKSWRLNNKSTEGMCSLRKTVQPMIGQVLIENAPSDLGLKAISVVDSRNNSADVVISMNKEKCVKVENDKGIIETPLKNTLHNSEKRNESNIEMYAVDGTTKSRKNKQSAKFSCSICSKKFCGLKTLSNHMKIAHEDCKIVLLENHRTPGREKCQKCFVLFPNKRSLNEHAQKVNLHDDKCCILAEGNSIDLRKDVKLKVDSEQQVRKDGLKTSEIKNDFSSLIDRVVKQNYVSQSHETKDFELHFGDTKQMDMVHGNIVEAVSSKEIMLNMDRMKPLPYVESSKLLVFNATESRKTLQGALQRTFGTGKSSAVEFIEKDALNKKELTATRKIGDMVHYDVNINEFNPKEPRRMECDCASSNTLSFEVLSSIDSNDNS